MAPEIFSSLKHTDNKKLSEDIASNPPLNVLNRSGHPLSAYCYRPSKMRFETQGDNEEIILFLRAHPITTFGWILTGILLVITPVFLFPYLLLNNFLPIKYAGFIPAVILVWYLFTFSYLLVSFLLWYFTVSIVTNERIIDIDQINILNNKFSATILVKVEDVTMRRGGLISTFFDFGNVFIQTAGTEENFEFLEVPHPEEVVKIINNISQHKE